MSITDDVMAKAPDGISKASDMTLKTAKEAKESIKDAVGTVKGICILLGKGVGFTESAVMLAVKAVAFKSTGDIKFSRHNIDIAKLRKSGHVYRVEEKLESEVMSCFDEQCKKHGIKYSAMVDTRGQDKPDYKPTYMLFYEGRDSDTIMSALQEAWKDYAEKQSRDEPTEKKDRWWQKSKDKEEKPEQRESVKAKLAFFRDRVAARDEQERDMSEKHHQHSDIQR